MVAVHVDDFVVAAHVAGVAVANAHRDHNRAGADADAAAVVDASACVARSGRRKDTRPAIKVIKSIGERERHTHNNSERNGNYIVT